MPTLNNYIKTLQKIVEENPEAGDLMVIVSSDSEGNSFAAPFYDPSLVAVRSYGNELEIISEDDVDDCVETQYAICLN